MAIAQILLDNSGSLSLSAAGGNFVGALVKLVRNLFTEGNTGSARTGDGVVPGNNRYRDPSIDNGTSNPGSGNGNGFGGNGNNGNHGDGNNGLGLGNGGATSSSDPYAPDYLMNPVAHVSYSYSTGNRTSMTADGQTTNYTYNAVDELTQAGDTSYQYDANGNMTTKTNSSGTLVPRTWGGLRLRILTVGIRMYQVR